MTPTASATYRGLGLKDLTPLCASPGPCITITLSAFRPGVQSPYRVRLKAAVRLAGQELAKQNSFSQIDELLAPFDELANGPEMEAGGRDMAIFRSPGVFQRFHLPGAVRERVVVARHFHITPFLKQLLPQREFHILAVSRKHLRLLRFLDSECKEVALPSGIPHNVEEAGSFDAPDHMLRNRSSAGSSAGAMPAVSFGTGTEREKTHERIEQFFRLVDRGLGELLQGLPLLLAGVDYEVALYRRAATYPHIMNDRLAGDPRILALQDIARLAGEIAQTEAQHLAGAALERHREKAGAGRTSTEAWQILPVASEGRVAELILAEGAELPDPPESMQDVLNAAAVLTLASGGNVFMLSAHRMGPEAPIAALYRY
jgi:Bacterial archaeo-eukaryotic release factor family 3